MNFLVPSGPPPIASNLLNRLLKTFPLLTFPGESPGTEFSDQHAREPSNILPKLPTLWIYGPGLDGSNLSFDVDCLRYQLLFKFLKLEHCLKNVSSPHCAPDGQMPALYLPDGRLLRPHEIDQWVAEQFCQNGRPKLELPSKETDEWLVAVENKIRPAIIANLHWNQAIFNKFTLPLYYPKAVISGNAAFLSRLLNLWTASYHLYPPLSSTSIENSDLQSPKTLSSYLCDLLKPKFSCIEKLEDQAMKTFEELEACLQQPNCMLKHDGTSITWLEISLLAYLYLVQNIIKPVIVDSNFQSKFLRTDRQNDFSKTEFKLKDKMKRYERFNDWSKALLFTLSLPQ
ncbi:expressed protein [Phakopsora pachyrhizi]|uniref:Expressed protein n=1 Tax=Phakopsora pachyrhizi TaxID=170000 RepID=A0AAV0B9N3_PHAPC|nr:expressed protein [Phakopsora pachyrhizi]